MTIDELLKDHQTRHSDEQMDWFITGMSGGTSYGMYKQALRELDRRVETLWELYASRELIALQLRAARRWWRRIRFTARGKHCCAIGLARQERAYARLLKTIAETQQEAERFYKQASALREKLDELTTERRSLYESEMWEHRVRVFAVIDIIACNRLSARTIEMIAALPIARKNSVRASLGSQEARQKLVEWYWNQESRLPCLDNNGKEIGELCRSIDWRFALPLPEAVLSLASDRECTPCAGGSGNNRERRS